MEEFTMIIEWSHRGFEIECEKLWKEGWRPLFPHVIHAEIDKDAGTTERYVKYHDQYSQQWTRTKNLAADG